MLNEAENAPSLIAEIQAASQHALSQKSWLSMMAAQTTQLRSFYHCANPTPESDW